MTHVYQQYIEIKEKIKQVTQSCKRNPQDVQLVAVTKNYHVEVIQQAYLAGCRDFGENRVQEALGKQLQLPSDLRWHFIGTLQSNKINKVISHFQLIHSVDTIDLAKRISKASEEKGMTTSILLQVNTSGEKSKHGLSEQEWRVGIKQVDQLPFIRLEGLMTMAPFIEDEKFIRQCFRRLRLLKDEFQQTIQQPALFKHLSMGMSHDYLIAIEEGATLVRIGSAIFS